MKIYSAVEQGSVRASCKSDSFPKMRMTFFVSIRNNLVQNLKFNWTSSYKLVVTVRDALKKGGFSIVMFLNQMAIYPQQKKEILGLVPQCGYWRNLQANK